MTRKKNKIKSSLIVIPESYYKKKIKVELTKQDIDSIIDELRNVPHNLFMFFNYDKLIKKLRSKR